MKNRNPNQREEPQMARAVKFGSKPAKPRAKSSTPRKRKSGGGGKSNSGGGKGSWKPSGEIPW